MLFFRIFIAILLLLIIGLSVDIPWGGLGQVRVWSWALLCGLSVFVFFALAIQFRHSIQMYKKYISYTDAVLLSASNTFLNTVLPLKAGVVARGIYLKKTMNLDFSKYLGAVLSVQLLSWLAWLFFLAGILSFNDEGHDYSWLIWLLFSMLLVLVVFLFQGGANKVVSVPIVTPSVSDCFKVVTAATALFVVLTLRLYISAELVSVELGMYIAAQMVLISLVALVVSFTPGNLGVREGLLLAVSSQYSMDIGDVTLVLLLDRVSSLIVTLALGGGAVYVLGVRLRTGKEAEV